MTDRSIIVRLRADVSDYVRNLGAAGDRTREATQNLGGWVSANTQSINKVSNGVGIVGAAMVGAATVAVAKFADFDAAMSNVAATGDDAKGSLDGLRQAALDAGADTVYSATEAAGAIENLAKAGVSSADILGGGLTGALDLAAAGSLDVADAAEIAATAMTQFSLDGKDMTHVADLLAAGAGKAQGDVTDMAMALKQSGLVAAQFGLSIEETVGSLTAFAAAGLLGSDAGTSFRTMLLRMANPSDEAAGLMDDLGIAAYNAQGDFVGMASLAGQLQDAMAGLPQVQRDAALATIFGSDAIRAANVLMTEGRDGIEGWTAAVDDQGFAAEVAATRLDNLKGDLEKLSGSFETALIGLGEGGNGPLRGLVQSATEVVDAFGQMPKGAQDATLGIVGVGGLVLLGIAGLGKLVVSVNEVRVALGAMGLTARASSLAVSMGKIAGVAGGMFAAAAATGMLVEALTTGDVALGAHELERSVRQLSETGAIRNLDAQFDNFGTVLGMSRSHVDSFGEALDSVFDNSMNAKATRAFEWIPGVDSDIEIVEKRFAQLDGTLAELTSGGHADEAAAAFKTMTDEALAQGHTVEELNQLFPQYSDALIGAMTAADDAAAATTAQTDAQAMSALATDEATEATKEQQEALAEWRESVREADAAFVDLGGAYDQMVEHQKALAESAAAESESATDSWEDFYDTTNLTAQEYIDNLQAQVTAQQNWETNITDLTTKARTTMRGDMEAAAFEMIDALIKLGPEGAAQVQLLHDMSDTEFQQVVALYDQKGVEAVTEFNNSVEAAKVPVLPTPQVTSQADAVSLFLAQQQAILNQKKLTAYIQTVATLQGGDSSARYAAMAAAGLAEGGPVTGPGGPTSDNVPALLSPGEWVINAAAVNKYGAGLFANLNARRYADGGQVAAMPTGATLGGLTYATPSPTVTIAGARLTGSLDLGNGLVGVIDARVAKGMAGAARAASATRSTTGRAR